MSKFSYFEAGETADPDFENNEELAVDEAQVIATLHVARALESIGEKLGEILDFLHHNSIRVDSESENIK